MIAKIKFKNYKRFEKEQVLEIRPITVLVGRNSSGKSSIAKLLSLLAHSVSEDAVSPLLFESDGVRLGTSFADICHDGNMLGLGFTLEYNNNCKITAELASDSTRQEVSISRYSVECGQQYVSLELKKGSGRYESSEGNDVTYGAEDFTGLLNGELLEKNGIETKILGMNVDYIGPFRCMPERTVYASGNANIKMVGPKGESAYQALSQSKEIEAKVSAWYEKAFAGCTMKVERVEGEYGAYHVNYYKKDSQHGINIADEGMGMSQVLPIIVRANMAVENSIVVIEQPELHLHPQAHVEIARLLAETSKRKKGDGSALRQRYVVETHSENILLGLRDAVVDKNVNFNPDDVIIYFVMEKEDGTSTLEPIYITEKGELTFWPKGVFNEAYELLKTVQKKANS